MAEMYVCLALHRWTDCELSHLPKGMFDGLNNGSVGFMAVFDDIDALKAAYPSTDIIKIASNGGAEL